MNALSILFGVLAICNLSVACEGPSFALLQSSQLATLQKGFCSRPGLAGTVKPWSVPCTDVKSAERQLPNFLSSLDKNPSHNISLGFRQHIGFEREGKRFLFISNVPEDDQIPRGLFLTKIRDVCDGGRYVWSVEFSVTDSTFDHFRTSGPDVFPDNSPSPFTKEK